jgi:glycosyltransferase involved in cell wall biosynthesis
MRILHILDAAGVACIYAKYQRLQGHDSKVIWNKDVGDKYGIYDFYKDYLINVTYSEFSEKCLQEGESCDVIHVHGYIDILFKLRKKFHKSKKIVLHYHGTDIRGLNNQELPHRSRLSDTAIRLKRLYRQKIGHGKAQKSADSVCVSTPDLLSLVSNANAILIPIPIDTKHFRPNPDTNGELKDAFTINSEVTNIQWAIDFCKKNHINLNIEVYDRTKNPLMYVEIPDLIRSYRTYVDIRYVNDTVLENLSSTALQALACGLRVLDFKLQFRQGLPPEHDAVNVVSQLSTIYKDIGLL